MKPLYARLPWTSLALAWLAALGVLFVWLAITPNGLLREQLKGLQFWSLESCAALGLVLGVAVAREASRLLDRRDTARLVVLGTLALLLTVFVAPRTNRIFYDEQIYQNIGQNMADLKLAQMCNDGNVEYGWLRCSNGEYNKQPYAYPHLLSLFYRLVGVHENVAFAMNAAAGVLTVCSVYALVLVLFDDRLAAFFAALLLALTPEQIVWSATAASEPASSLACVLAVMCAAYFVRSRSTPALAAAATAAAYSVQFRPESLLVAPVIGLLLWQGARDEFAKPRLWWAGLLFLCLVAVHIGHSFAVRNEGWGTNEARLSWRYALANLPVNGGFYLGDERFPIVFTILGVLGLASRQPRKGRMVMAVYFLLFFGIALLFYAGSYNYGADVRYSLMTYPPLTVLGGLGLARLMSWVEQMRPTFPIRRLATAGLVFQFLAYAPLVRATTEEAWAARTDVRFARSVARGFPANAYVLTHNPGMFQVWGVNAGQMSLVATNPNYLEYLSSRYAGGVYLHWNFWCNVEDPTQRGFCRKVLDLGPVEVAAKHLERDQVFVFYKIGQPASVPTSR
jgi:hypothetical protein